MNINLVILSKRTHKEKHYEWTLLIHSKKTLTDELFKKFRTEQESI